MKCVEHRDFPLISNHLCCRLFRFSALNRFVTRFDKGVNQKRLIIEYVFHRSWPNNEQGKKKKVRLLCSFPRRLTRYRIVTQRGDYLSIIHAATTTATSDEVVESVLTCRR